MNTDLLKQVIDKLGGNSSELPDNLLTTHLKAMCEALGVDTSEVQDNLMTTYLKAMHKSEVPDNLMTTHLEALCSTLGIDTSDMEDRLASSYFKTIVGGEVSGGGNNSGGSNKTYADQLYEHFEVDSDTYPYIILYFNNSSYRLYFVKNFSGSYIYEYKLISASVYTISDKTNVENVVSYALENYTKDNLSASSGTRLTVSDVAYYYVNFDIVTDMKITVSNVYRLDE